MIVVRVFFIISICLMANCSHKRSAADRVTPKAKSQTAVVENAEVTSSVSPGDQEISLDVRVLFDRLRPNARSGRAKHHPIIKQGQSGLMLKTDLPRTTREAEWYDSQVQFFYDKQTGRTYQLAIHNYTCNVDNSVESKQKIRQRFEQATDKILTQLFGRPLVIKDGYFKMLGPYWEKTSRVLLSTQRYEPATKLRLSRSLYKCDGRRGYGFRLDLFFK